MRKASSIMEDSRMRKNASMRKAQRIGERFLHEEISNQEEISNHVHDQSEFRNNGKNQCMFKDTDGLSKQPFFRERTRQRSPNFGKIRGSKNYPMVVNDESEF